MEDNNQRDKILIVDDIPENNLALEKILGKLDVTVVKAGSGNEALSATLYHDFALILLDVQMPGMDGYEVAEFLKDDEKTRMIPIIFVTAIDSDAAKEIKGYTHGAVDFIFKPLNEFILLSKVRIFLDIHRNEKALEGMVRKRTHELEKAFEDLSKSEYRYRTLFEKSSDAVFIVRKENCGILDANRAALTLLGRSAEAAKHLSIRETVAENGDALFDAVSRPGPGREIGTVSYRRPDDELRITRMRVLPLGEDSVICIAKDITHDLEMEKRLRQSQKMESIGTLAGGIAHDFNNILASIMGNTELLLTDADKDTPLEIKLRRILTGTVRAKDLVHQILTFARQDDNTAASPMRIQHIVKEVLKMIRATAPSTVAIASNVAPECGMITASPTQIHQIMMNLSTNACHAMNGSGGKLTVSLTEIPPDRPEISRLGLRPSRHARLTVADTGTGMDERLVEKIFDPFFTTKEKGKGTGMGLAVVHGIVKSIGGGIRVETGPGEGAAFHVYLPVTEASPGKTRRGRFKGVQRGKERVLLVDDEMEIVQVGSEILEHLGYRVVSHTDSRKALEDFRNRPRNFDIVITDLTMPGLPGDKLSAELLKINPAIPILLCTGNSETMNKQTLAAGGIRGFLKKPVVIEELSQTMRKALDQNRNL